MVGSVISEVAALAPCAQIVVVAVLGHVVEMRDREHDLRPFASAIFRRLAVAEQTSVIGSVDLAVALEPLERSGVLVDAANDRVAIFDEALFAAITGSREDARADLWPVSRIAVAVLRLDRHSVLPH